MTTTTTRPHLEDVRTLAERAREGLMRGAVTDAYELDLAEVEQVLNASLATEMVCVLRYKHHYHASGGPGAQIARAEFLEHAAEEQDHADRIAKRIVELGGTPNFSPEGMLSRSHSTFATSGAGLRDMLVEDLLAERVAIDVYREMIAFFGYRDPTTRRLLEEILEQEEEHADDLATLLEGHPSTGEA